MTTIQEKITVMQAFCDGVECEYRECNTNKKKPWSALINSINDSSVSPSWNWTRYEYRIKPKPREISLIVSDSGEIVVQAINSPLHPFITSPHRNGELVLFREVVEE